MQARTAAVKVLTEVVNGVSLSRALPVWQAKVASKDQPLLQELCYGVLRWHARLDLALTRLMQKPLKIKDRDIHCLLLLGLYQLDYMRIPDHAAVTESVNVARLLKKQWAGSLINGVLRNYLRNKESINSKLDESDVAYYAHPNWLLQETQQAWPDDWRRILESNNQHPPMTLRVNLNKSSMANYERQLQAKDISYQRCRFSDCGVTLVEARAVETLPLFHNGGVSVQDQAAQLAAQCLDLQAGHRVLDVCAAPGGKAAHILEKQPGIRQLLALDHDAQRLQRINENMQRLGCEASIVLGDATSPETWWDGEPFDRILLDAPCTASGVIRRHPDAKILKKQSDIEAISKLQAQILDAVWPLLRPGGMLLYATCSIWPQENVLQVKSFIERTQNANHRPLRQEWGRSQLYGRQILTGEEQMDGFYYACLVKQ